MFENKKKLIESSVEKKQGNRAWDILFRSRDEDNFKTSKILIRQTADRLIASLDEVTGYYAIDSVNVLKLKTEFEKLYKVIVAILNSKLMLFFYRQISQEGGRVLAQVKPSRIKAIPIPEIPATEQAPFTTLVEEILAKKQRGEETEELERRIDEMVYVLYGLTAEEIAVVEGAGK